MEAAFDRALLAWRAIQKTSGLSLTEGWLLFLALFHLAYAAALLRTRPVSDIPGLTRSKSNGAFGASTDAGRAAMVGWAISVASRWVPWSANCLVQAVAASFLLRRYGFDPNIVIGVRRDGPNLAAHAWVECDDVSVVGGRGEGFTPLRATLSGQAAAVYTNIPSWI